MADNFLQFVDLVECEFRHKIDLPFLSSSFIFSSRRSYRYGEEVYLLEQEIIQVCIQVTVYRYGEEVYLLEQEIIQVCIQAWRGTSSCRLLFVLLISTICQPTPNMSSIG
ncbi:hypothetical protein ElyMa_004274500 [Elysia marginata]|uniref:Uncharacterized protein n=1 Tax=Elysia marginata TaxID=1093978 RepID=A0AAV4GUB1_9GAST|nr:hypothetical protein ElyMa_004274500 [Elysia marginata]